MTNVKMKFGEAPNTTYMNNLESIHAQVMHYTPISELVRFLPDMYMATWNEHPDVYINPEAREKIVNDVLRLKTLPAAAESIQIVWELQGISIQEVTHILRHRMFSFAADCSGDKWWHDRRALVPCSILNSSELFERYAKITEDAKQLYCDMIDTKQISIMDARYILPRNLETYYFIRTPYNELVRFIQQRLDRQIQPETDNVIAMQMAIAVAQIYPQITEVIPTLMPASGQYIRSYIEGTGSDLYRPDDITNSVMMHQVHYDDDMLVYQQTRDEMIGTDGEEDDNMSFKYIAEYLCNEYKQIKDKYDESQIQGSI